jgi:hypothetical protein
MRQLCPALPEPTAAPSWGAGAGSEGTARLGDGACHQKHADQPNGLLVSQPAAAASPAAAAPCSLQVRITLCLILTHHQPSAVGSSSSPLITPCSPFNYIVHSSAPDLCAGRRIPAAARRTRLPGVSTRSGLLSCCWGQRCRCACGWAAAGRAPSCGPSTWVAARSLQSGATQPWLCKVSRVWVSLLVTDCSAAMDLAGLQRAPHV